MNRRYERRTICVLMLLSVLTMISGCRALSERLEPAVDENLKVVNREKPDLSDRPSKTRVDPDSDKLQEEKIAPVEKVDADLPKNGRPTGAGCSGTPAETEIFIYSDADFAGTCVLLSETGYQSPNMDNVGIPNDSISSIKVGDKVRAVLCEHNDYQGKCQSFGGSRGNLAKTYVGNDSVSSLKILDKKQDTVEVNFLNRTDETVLIYELVGGVRSFLEAIGPNGAGKVSTTVMTMIACGGKGTADGKISDGIQIKDASSKTINIIRNPDGSFQMTETE